MVHTDVGPCTHTKVRPTRNHAPHPASALSRKQLGSAKKMHALNVYVAVFCQQSSSDAYGHMRWVLEACRVVYNHVYVCARCIYGILGRDTSKYTVMYGAYVPSWPIQAIKHGTQKLFTCKWCPFVHTRLRPLLSLSLPLPLSLSLSLSLIFEFALAKTSYPQRLT